MNLSDYAVDTAIAVPGMSVRELFDACVKADVPGLPFRAANGKIVGKASMRNILREKCIPQFMVDTITLIGDRIEGLKYPKIEEQELLGLEIDDYVMDDFATITPASPIAKALAVMEAHDTTYVFVIDADQNYYGTVTIMHLARRILERNR